MFQVQSLVKPPQRLEFDTALTETNPRTPKRIRKKRSSFPTLMTSSIGHRSPAPMSESLINTIKKQNEPKKLTGNEPNPNFDANETEKQQFVAKTGWRSLGRMIPSHSKKAGKVVSLWSSVS